MALLSVTVLGRGNTLSGSMWVSGILVPSSTYSEKSGLGKGVPIKGSDLGMQNIHWVQAGRILGSEDINSQAAVAVPAPLYSTDANAKVEWLVKLYSSAGTEWAVGSNMKTITGIAFFAIGNAN